MAAPGMFCLPFIMKVQKQIMQVQDKVYLWKKKIMCIIPRKEDDQSFTFQYYHFLHIFTQLHSIYYILTWSSPIWPSKPSPIVIYSKWRRSLGSNRDQLSTLLSRFMTPPIFVFSSSFCSLFMFINHVPCSCSLSMFLIRGPFLFPHVHVMFFSCFLPFYTFLFVHLT